MNLVAVNSSMLIAVGYDAENRVLEALFHSGQVWQYCDVPEEVYRDLLAADSIGSYMQEEVIGHYPEYQVKRRRR